MTFQEAREHQLEREKVEEEMRELSDAVEMATLDKEMAEEKVSGQMIHCSLYHTDRKIKFGS